MLDGLNNLILAQRNGRGEDNPWIQLLVLIAVFVIYGLRAIVRAKVSGKEQRPEASEPVDKKYKPITPQREERQAERAEKVYEPAAVFPQQRAAVMPGRLSKQAFAKQQRLMKMKAAYEQKQRKAEIDKRQKAQQQVKKPTEQPDKITAKQIGSERLSEELGDAEKIRRAIIYSEILGKPLALREQN